jgi:hypothetical protein
MSHRILLNGYIGGYLARLCCLRQVFISELYECCSSSLDFKGCERKYSWPVSKYNLIIQLVGLRKTKNET